MALRFKCEYCDDYIIVKHLKPGEPAKCYACGKENIVPESAEQVDDRMKEVRIQTETARDSGVSSNIKHEDEVQIISGKPLRYIWTNPRGTIRYLIDNESHKPALFFAGVYGIVLNLHLILRHSEFIKEGTSIPVIIVMNVVFGFVYGIFLLYFFSLILPWISKILKGKGSPKDVRIALGWAAVPYFPLFILLISILLIWGDQILFGGNIQGSKSVVVNSGSHPIEILYLIVRSIVTIWFIILTLTGISEVTKLSIGKSILSALILLALISIYGFGIIMLVTTFVR